MAQNELRLRLIKDDKKVGELNLGLGGIFYVDGSFKFPCYIKSGAVYALQEDIAHEEFHCLASFDSLELGIKGGDEWWFEGDEGIDGTFKKKFMLRYSTIRLVWEMVFDDSSYGSLTCEVFKLSESKRIDNIHNKEMTDGTD